jgi:hypothetical protein
VSPVITMTLGDALVEVWKQAMVVGSPTVEVEGRSYRVGRTRSMGLRTLSFSYQTHTIEGIEQNPQTKSRWAKLATEGQKIMQFKCNGRYIGNVCEGKLMRYPSWTSQGLPD